jgi:hypothetical protein
MRVLKRRPVSKHRSAKAFRHHARKTKAPNMGMSPQRGGWRL